LIEEDTNIIESVLLNRPNPALEFIQLKISGIKHPGLYEASYMDFSVSKI
jgi:hypothetical protein